MLLVSSAVNLQLNVNDLVALHRHTCTGLRQVLRDAPERARPVDLQIFDLLRRLERAAIETTDCPCEVAGQLINTRALLERVVHERAAASV